MAALFGLLAFILAALLGLAVAFYFQAKGEAQTARQDLARYQGIADLEKYKAELENRLRNARVLLPKFETLAEMEQHKAQLAKTLEEFKQASAERQGSISAQESTLARLTAQTQAVEETLEMQSFGFYRPK